MRLLHAGLCHEPVRRAVSAAIESGPATPLALAGNLCRCTGYRPIRDAALSLGPRTGRRVSSIVWTRPAPRSRAVSIRRLLAGPAPSMSAWPCCATIPARRLVAGGTDLGVESNLAGRRWPHLVSVEAIDELREYSRHPRRVTHRRGAAADRHRAALDGCARGVSRVADAVRVAAHPQSRHARRQSGDRVADRRRRAAAARARRDRAHRRAVRPPVDAALVVSSPATGGRLMAAGEIITAIEIPKPLPAVPAFLQGGQAPAGRHQHGGGGDGARLRIRTASFGARGSRSAAWRRRRSAWSRPRRPSSDQVWNEAAVERVQAVLERDADSRCQRPSRVQRVSARGVEEPRREVSVGAVAVTICRHVRFRTRARAAT